MVSVPFLQNLLSFAPSGVKESVIGLTISHLARHPQPSGAERRAHNIYDRL